MSEKVTQPKKPLQKSLILRFQRTEILLHWAIAIPFLVCYVTAAILVVVYNAEPTIAFRAEISWLHKISALGFMIFPPTVLLMTRRSWRVHLQNIKEGWSWKWSEFRWLMITVANAFGLKFKLPDSEKFNAAEKINFMMVMTFYPLFIVTGVLIFVFQASLAAWVAHFAMALLATPLIWGHIYMAVIHKDTRTGLSGMITGYVDRDWADHHYHKWFHRNFEKLAIERAAKPVEHFFIVKDVRLAASLILLGQRYRGHLNSGASSFYFDESAELSHIIDELKTNKIHVNQFYHADIVKKLGHGMLKSS